MQPELRFRRTMASLVVFYLVCLALGAFAVVVLIETHGSAAARPEGHDLGAGDDGAAVRMP